MSDDFDTEEYLKNFLRTLSSAYSAQVDVICSAGARSNFRAEKQPVSRGRQGIIDAYNTQKGGNSGQAKLLLAGAITTLDSGSVHPDASEWLIDGPEVGRAHACMWSGIAKVFAHKQSRDTFDRDATNADSWFAMATILFFSNNEPKLAARALQEWSESRRMFSDLEAANVLSLGAVCSFALIGENERLAVAASRTGQSTSTSVDSSFFLGRPPMESELRHLTTVLGGRNSEAFYAALR